MHLTLPHAPLLLSARPACACPHSTIYKLTKLATHHSPKQGGVEEVVAQLRAALETDPEGFANDETTRAILERLNEEVARLYEEEAADGGVDGSQAEVRTDGGYNEGAPGEEGGESTRSLEHGVTRRSSSGAARVLQLPKGPTPYELWKAAHEVDRRAKDEVRAYRGGGGGYGGVELVI